MNDKLFHFLTNLDNQEAANVWKWLDSNPEAIQEMIEVIANSHINLIAGEVKCIINMSIQ